MIQARNTFFILLFILVLIGLSSPARPGGFGTLQGKVTDMETGKPIAGVLVKVKAEGGITARTNEMGVYIFNNTVPQGKHNVVFRKEGYKRRIKWGVRIESGTNTLNIRLKPRSQ